jgi:hypothetical protein
MPLLLMAAKILSAALIALLQVLLLCNGSVLDALLLWRSNVQKVPPAHHRACFAPPLLTGAAAVVRGRGAVPYMLRRHRHPQSGSEFRVFILLLSLPPLCRLPFDRARSRCRRRRAGRATTSSTRRA